MDTPIIFWNVGFHFESLYANYPYFGANDRRRLYCYGFITHDENNEIRKGGCFKTEFSAGNS